MDVCNTTPHCVSHANPCVVDHACCPLPPVPPVIVEQPMAVHEWVEPVVHHEQHHISHQEPHIPHNHPERSSRLNLFHKNKLYYWRDSHGQRYSYRVTPEGRAYEYNKYPPFK